MLNPDTVGTNLVEIKYVRKLCKENKVSITSTSQLNQVINQSSTQPINWPIGDCVFYASNQVGKRRTKVHILSSDQFLVVTKEPGNL